MAQYEIHRKRTGVLIDCQTLTLTTLILLHHNTWDLSWPTPVQKHLLREQQTHRVGTNEQ